MEYTTDSLQTAEDFGRLCDMLVFWIALHNAVLMGLLVTFGGFSHVSALALLADEAEVFDGFGARGTEPVRSARVELGDFAGLEEEVAGNAPAWSSSLPGPDVHRSFDMGTTAHWCTLQSRQKEHRRKRQK